LVGFGQLFVSRDFMTLFGEYMRFWYGFLYLIVALANIVAINVYLGIMKKLINYAKAFMLTITFPALTLTVFFLANYAQVAVHPLVMIPQMSWETTFIGMVSFDTFVVGLGTYIFFKPKWWYIAVGAGTAITGAGIYASIKPTWGESAFVLSAIGLAVACVIVLGISVYVLARIWRVNLKERKQKKEVKE
jgi:hypothetical protein